MSAGVMLMLALVASLIVAVVLLINVLRDRKVLIGRDCNEQCNLIQGELNRMHRACEHLPSDSDQLIFWRSAQQEMNYAKTYLREGNVWDARLCLFSAMSAYRKLLCLMDYVPKQAASQASQSNA